MGLKEGEEGREGLFEGCGWEVDLTFFTFPKFFSLQNALYSTIMCLAEEKRLDRQTDNFRI